jgi:hypothetical protein
MKNIAYWYLGKYYTYIRVYKSSGAPHLLPYYVPDRLLIREIAYHTMGTGINSLLLGSSKKLGPHSCQYRKLQLIEWSSFPKRGRNSTRICLCLGEARGHDPQYLALNHIKSMVSLTLTYMKLILQNRYSKEPYSLKKYCKCYLMMWPEENFN